MKTLLRTTALGAVALIVAACNDSSNVAVSIAPSVPSGRFIVNSAIDGTLIGR